jgi:hypothetical protein
MRRRDFIKVVAGSVAAWPLGTRAQPDDRKRRIGYLSPITESDPENQSWVREFTQRLHELGWTDGRNVRIDFRFGNAVDPMRISMLATELVEDHPDVIIASGWPLPSRCDSRLSPYRSFLCKLPIRSQPVSSQTWRGRRATSPASPILSFRSAESGCSS